MVMVGLMAALLMPLQQVEAQDEVAWLLEQINAVRANVGLPGYTLNGTLSAAALAHSQWMASSGNISHTGADGSTPSSRAAAWGYGGSRVSENIYGGMMATAQIALNFWINSPVHYAGLTSADKNEIGIGIHNGHYTLLFGRSGGYVAPPPPPTQEAPAPVNEAAPPPQQSAPAAPAQNAPPAAPTEAPRPTRSLPTWTPSPTIASATPTLTWTPTFTWTPSPTASQPPPTSTPITLSQLPTMPVIELASLLSSATPEIALAPSGTPQASTQVILMPVQPKPVVVTAEKSGFDWRLILPILVATQVVIFCASIWWLFVRRR